MTPLKKLGEAGLVDTCATIGMFNGITKVADMTGCKQDMGFITEVKKDTVDALDLNSWRRAQGVRVFGAEESPPAAASA